MIHYPSAKIVIFFVITKQAGTNNITFVKKMLDAMSVEELKNRLATYMMADENLTQKGINAEV